MKRQTFTIDQIVLAAMFMGMIVALILIIRIPIPGSHGYIHLGDSMIFLAVLALGKKNGALAAGIGSALADVIGGYAVYAPVSLVAKALMAYIMGVFIERALARSASAGTGKVRAIMITGMVIGGLVMVASYYAAETVMYGNPVIPLAGAGMNCIQFAVGGVIAFALESALEKTPAGKKFAYSTVRK